MASWAPERRKMSVLPSELQEARLEDAKKLLRWSADFERLDTPNVTYAEFQKREEQ